MDELLTKEEVSKWLKVSQSTIDRWRKAGLPFIKTGRLTRFNQEEILKWLKENHKK